MSTMNQVMRSAWAQMTTAEQQQYQQQLIAQASGGTNNNTNYNNTTNYNSNKSLADQQAEMRTQQMYWDVMNNMSMQSHVTSLNRIENIGGSGNYWEITNNPW